MLPIGLLDVEKAGAGRWWEGSPEVRLPHKSPQSGRVGVGVHLITIVGADFSHLLEADRLTGKMEMVTFYNFFLSTQLRLVSMPPD